MRPAQERPPCISEGWPRAHRRPQVGSLKGTRAQEAETGQPQTWRLSGERWRLKMTMIQAKIPESWSPGRATPQPKDVDGRQNHDQPVSPGEVTLFFSRVQTRAAGFKAVAQPCPVRLASDQVMPRPFLTLGCQAGILGDPVAFFLSQRVPAPHTHSFLKSSILLSFLMCYS